MAAAAALSAAVVGLLLLAPALITAESWHHEDQGAWSGDCQGTTSQSPIDLDPEAATYDDSLASLTFENYHTNIDLHINNNNHAIQFDVGSSGTTLGISEGGLPAGATYELLQMHFHWGAHTTRGGEHTINGFEYPLELHFVHWNSQLADVATAITTDEGLAVVGVFFEMTEREEEASALQEFIDLLHHAKNGGETADNVVQTDLRKLLPLSISDFLRYPGSLTTPPCSESVVWTVMLHPLKVTAAQMQELRFLDDEHGEPIKDNYRVVQGLNGRTVLRSFRINEPGGSSGKK